jgi:hypothetical protein
LTDAALAHDALILPEPRAGGQPAATATEQKKRAALLNPATARKMWLTMFDFK